MIMEETSFGDWLRRSRKALDLTQAELADRVGCSAAAIRKIEAQERRPSAQIATRLAQIFAIPPGEWAGFVKFARGGWQAALRVPGAGAPWRESRLPAPSNLPSTTTLLVGRETDIARLRGELLHPPVRLVTLIGPPGIGKTRLCLEVGREMQADFADGVFFVALAPLEEPSQLAATILQALGYVEARNLSTKRQLIDGIEQKQLLLVLDNCEHLVEEAAGLASGLLEACPGLKILTSSRESLRLPGEWLYPVPALDIPRESAALDLQSAARYPALTLFAECARLVQPDFSLNPGNISAVASICMQLDGLPLAIELFAARMRLMSPQALLERLTDEFVLSADGMRGLHVRQKTLGNAIDWSYRTLPLEEQELFAGLAVFAGGFTLAAVEAVFPGASRGRQVPDLVTALSDKSLLQRSLSPQGEVRFHMLATMRKFALERLRRNGKEVQAREQHLAYFLALAEKAAREMHGPEQAAWIARVEQERDDLRASLDWCVATENAGAGLRLLGALGWPWEVHSHYGEMHAWFAKIRALPGAAGDPAAYGTLLNHVGRFLWTQASWSEARDILEESRAAWVSLGEQGEQGLAEALNWLGIVAHYGDQDDNAAEAMLKQSLELFRKWGNPREALSIFHLGILESDRHQDGLAMDYFEHSLASFRQMGDLFFIARVSNYLGREYLKRGDFDNARHFLEQHLTLDRELQFWDGIASALNDLGGFYRHLGEMDRAAAYYQESLQICRAHGLIIRQPLVFLGWLALRRDDYPLAAQLFKEYFAPIRKTYNQDSAGFLLMGLAAVAGGEGQAERAAKLWGAAESLLGAPRDVLEAFDWAEFERHVQKARQQIGEDRFASLAAEGRGMSVDQAVAYALEKEINRRER